MKEKGPEKQREPGHQKVHGEIMARISSGFERLNTMAPDSQAASLQRKRIEHYELIASNLESGNITLAFNHYVDQLHTISGTLGDPEWISSASEEAIERVLKRMRKAQEMIGALLLNEEGTLDVGAWKTLQK